MTNFIKLQNGLLIVISLLLIIIEFPAKIDCTEIDYETKLKTDLFTNQHSLETHNRPVINYDDALQVQIQMYLRHIEELDETNETLAAQLLLRMEWSDTRIAWNQFDYGGIAEIVIPKELIWTPDMAIYNSLSNEQDVAWHNSLVKVKSSGMVSWTSPLETLTTCFVDLRKYPFDEHHCIIRMGSWTHHGFMINPHLLSGDIPVIRDNAEDSPDDKEPFLNNFQEHNLWDITNSSIAVETVMYQCCPEPYPSVVMSFVLKRKSPQFLMMLVLPTSTAIALLLSVFLFPPSSGHKISLGCFVLLYFLLLDVYAYWTIPRNGSGVPNIVVLIGSSVVLSSIAIIFSVITITLSRTSHQSGISIVVKNVLSSILGKILCLNHQNAQGLSDAATTSMVETENSSFGQVGKQHEWNVLAKAIDRILLILYCILYIILLTTLLG